MAKYDRLGPPGMNQNSWAMFVLVTMIGAALYSLICFTHYSLYTSTTYQMGQIIEIRRPWEFEDILVKAMPPYPIFAVSMLGFVISNYVYYYQESKSIYTMRRVRSRWELHRRSWTLPVLGAAGYLVLGAVMGLLGWVIYVCTEPKSPLFVK